MLIEKEENKREIPYSDKITIVILFFLYVLQGIPLGLADSTKFLLQNKRVTYKDQALFSLSDWPFSLKLLWAPIVDSLYWEELGRRKSWSIPAQTLIGICMFVLSGSISSLLGDGGNAPDVLLLTMVFFGLNFLAATQDIAVDGWALTMLSRQNVGYASLCNITGQKLGYFLGNVVFLVLESAEFCNNYLGFFPQPYGVVTFSGFLRVSGFTFIIATFIILIFKSEKKEDELFVSDSLSIKNTYCQLYHLLCLKNILVFIIFLLTFHISTAAVDAVTRLKFIEAGVSKEKVALLETPQSFIHMLLPFFMRYYVIGSKPLNLFLKAFPYQLMFGFLFAFLIWWTPQVKIGPGMFPSYYYLIVVVSFLTYKAVQICIHFPLAAFFNKISDPSIGGTYMTLLNTCSNLGSSWTSSLALLCVDSLTFKQCDNPQYSCDTVQSALKCTDAGHTCMTVFDGYYIEIVICITFGFVWIRWGRRVIHRLQVTTLSDWTTLEQLQSGSSKV